MSGRSVILRVVQYLLLFIAVVCLSWYGWRMYEIRREQARLTAEIEKSLRPVLPDFTNESEGSNPPKPSILPISGLIGELSIPSLKLTAPVTIGDSKQALDFSVGYLPDTPLPWMPGNSAFAAHRDRLFRPLTDIHTGDAIKLATTHGDLNYRVLKSLIVKHKDVWVLDRLPHVDLTLITCYPFYYVGNAPKRFIVQAEKVID
jgi:LPXTG-site transpeptidase (sortase) family protein